jgi:hypothetical protein
LDEGELACIERPETNQSSSEGQQTSHVEDDQPRDGGQRQRDDHHGGASLVTEAMTPCTWSQRVCLREFVGVRQQWV